MRFPYSFVLGPRAAEIDLDLTTYEPRYIHEPWYQFSSRSLVCKYSFLHFEFLDLFHHVTKQYIIQQNQVPFITYFSVWKLNTFESFWKLHLHTFMLHGSLHLHLRDFVDEKSYKNAFLLIHNKKKSFIMFMVKYSTQG